MTRTVRVLLAVLATTLLLGSPVRAVGAPAGPPAPRVTVQVTDKAAGDGFRATKTLSRVFTEPDGTETVVSSYDVAVKADKTQNLRGRQRMLVSWSGAQPSGGRASNPYGENGLQQEYPVVIMQCRGVDNATLPLAKQLRPETCWTASVAQRSQVLRSDSDSLWRQDLFEDDVDKARVSGIDPLPPGRGMPRCRHRSVRHAPDGVRRSRRHGLPGLRQRLDAAGSGRGCRLPAGRDRLVHRRERQRFGPVRGAQRRRERIARLLRHGCLLHRRHPDRRPQLCCANRADRDRRPRVPQARPLRPRVEQLHQRRHRPVCRSGPVVVGVQLAQPVHHPDHLRSAARHLRRARHPSAHRLLRLGAARPGGPPVVAGLLPEQEHGSSSS